MNKTSLRQHLRRLRAAVPPTARQRAARAAARLARPLLLRARRVGFYWPHGAEFDLAPLLRHAQTMRIGCYLPVVPRPRQRVMRFARLRRGQPLHKNRYGIPEPLDAHPLRARQLDLLFVPLVGVDVDGYRLGMGGGYYDATLAYLAHRRHWKKPLLIGVGYACQRVQVVPRDAWDVPLDGYLSEAGLAIFA